MQITEVQEKEQEPAPPARTSWLDRPVLERFQLNWETVLFAAILVLAVFSRLYILGARVISHDENTHVVFSWQLYKGLGYAHDPLSHGPLQFHLVALTFFLLGDTDFTARLPHALFSIATIAFMWNYRRYLGRAGALIAAFMLLISPYILFYGRYARNETFVGLFGVVFLWAVLRYLETGASRYLYWMTAATVLHFTAKETSFIYTAQALIFLALYLIYRLTRRSWPHPASRSLFLVALMIGILLVGASGATVMINRAGSLTATETAVPAVPGQPSPAAPAPAGPSTMAILLGVLGLLALLAAAYFLIRGFTLSLLRTERSFDLLVVLGTLVLPMLAPFPLRGLGWTVPTNLAGVNAMTITDMVRMGAVVIALALVAIAVGLWWNPRLWLGNAALFYAVFTVLYTTVFTNGAGFFTGLLGSLGYWLEQQGVQRGSQPWYYYAFIQVPVYEYLPALGSFLALVYSLRWWGLRPRPVQELPGLDSPALYSEDGQPQVQQPEPSPEDDLADFERPAGDPLNDRFTGQVLNTRPVVYLLGFWAVTSLVAYTIAGEKMPWLTFHIALPMILLSGWSFGRLVNSIDWSAFLRRRGVLVVVLLPVFITSLLGALGAVLGPNPPFSGKELAQLQSTGTFITSLLVAVFSGYALVSLARSWQPGQLGRVLGLGFIALLAVLTARTAITASFISYDNANELLVYAHGGPGQKQALEQIEEISRRMTGGLNLNVAYDNETNYSYWWYLRNYPNKIYYGTEPTRALRDSPVIAVGDTNYQKIEPVVGQGYYQFDYIRLWWPNQDYYDLTWERILFALRDPQMRAAIFQIWLNRDYSLYGKITNKQDTTNLAGWYPSALMRLYIRKDVAAKLWNYGIGPQEVASADPYASKKLEITSDRILGSPGNAPGQFQRPRDLAVAPDGSLYIADTDNHRIQHLDANGTVLQTWGSFADITKGDAPGGTFFEPWGIALGPDGSVYVADTWNHRIQKFTADGQFITMWGYFGQAEAPEALWGPRDVAVDSQGRVYVTDTGNKRIVVFDAGGKPVTQFGGAGLEPGQFDEPVGLAIGPEDQVYVADTWNQRVQVFIQDSTGSFTPLNSWDVSGWYGQALDNKPYLAADSQGNVFVTDPEEARVLEFNNEGVFTRYWGDYSTGPDGFALVGSVAPDGQGGVWVSDAGNSRIMHFTLP